MAPIVALAGFMGSGKTTVGRKAARLLDWDFLDLDREVVASTGLSIPSLFAEEGEAGFRRRESQILRDLVGSEPKQHGLILALGGGTLTSPDALAYVRERATVIYLEIDAEHAWSRVCRSDRPLARDREAFGALLDQRRATYDLAADHVLHVQGRTPDSIAAEVADIAQAIEALPT